MRRLIYRLFYVLLISQSISFAGSTQLELNQQSYQKRIATEEILNNIITDYKKKIDPIYVEAFNHSEENWQDYIQSYCKFISEKNQDGSIYPLVLNNCLTNQIIKHLNQLNQLVNCEEGDLQCLPIN